MKRLMILTVGVCLMFTALPAVAQSAADEAAIKAATKQANDGINNGDLKAHLDVYAHPYEGFSDSQDRAAHEKLHLDLSDLRLKVLDEISIVFLTPDVAIHKQRVEATGLTDDEGKALPSSKQTVVRVYVKKEGKWLTRAYYANTIEE